MTSTPDLTTLRSRSLRATVAFLREQVRDWPTNGTLENRFGGILLKLPESGAVSMHPQLEILVDSRPIAVPLALPPTHDPPRVGLPTSLATQPRDVALFLLTAVAQTDRRTTQLLYRPFREIYEADANGHLRLVGPVDEEELEHWP